MNRLVMRQATTDEITAIAEMQARLDAAVTIDLGNDVLKALASMGQLLVFERGDEIVGYVAVASLSDDAESRYVADGFLDLTDPGGNIWVLEYVGNDGDVREANRLFRDLMRKIGCQTYKFFRERDGKQHQVRIAA